MHLHEHSDAVGWDPGKTEMVLWKGISAGRNISVSATLNFRELGDVTVIDVAGKIKLGEGAASLRDAVRDLAGRNQKRILLNLAAVNYIDSSGIGEMVAAFTTLTNQGGQLKLLNLTKRVQDLLQITKLYTVFEVYDNEAHAIRSFSSLAATA
jgi:anti-sigma B factor antagonist